MSYLSNFGSSLNTLRTTLTNAGVNATTLPSILSSITGMFSTNPNKAQELQICNLLLTFAANPAMEQHEAEILASEVGLPVAAATLAMTLGQPGTNVVQTVLEIEQLINQT
jgi:hypothetical protein